MRVSVCCALCDSGKANVLLDLHCDDKPLLLVAAARVAQWKRVGFRSRRLWVRSPPRVACLAGAAESARCQDRTDDLGIMRPTRYRLRQPRPLARQSITPCGTRTRNLWIRSPTRYPLRQGGVLEKAPAVGIEPTTSGSGNRRASIAPRGLLQKGAVVMLGLEPRTFALSERRSTD